MVSNTRRHQTAIDAALDAALDRVAWTASDRPPPSDSGLPHATHEGELCLPGLPPLKVYQLNTGVRVFEEESVKRFFDSLT